MEGRSECGRSWISAAQGGVLTPILNSGELAIMFSFVFRFLSAAGGGAWSVDSERGSPAG